MEESLYSPLVLSNVAALKGSRRIQKTSAVFTQNYVLLFFLLLSFEEHNPKRATPTIPSIGSFDTGKNTRFLELLRHRVLLCMLSPCITGRKRVPACGRIGPLMQKDFRRLYARRRKFLIVEATLQSCPAHRRIDDFAWRAASTVFVIRHLILTGPCSYRTCK